MTLLTITLSHPGRTSKQRDRNRRFLTRIGAIRSKPGTYHLPESRIQCDRLGRLAVATVAAGGHAVLTFSAPSRQDMTKIFDRSASYAQIVDEISSSLSLVGGKPCFGRSAKHESVQLRSQLEMIRSIDFFPTEAISIAEERLERFEVEARKLNYLYVAGAQRKARELFGRLSI